jgi:hypothetical protein
MVDFYKRVRFSVGTAFLLSLILSVSVFADVTYETARYKVVLGSNGYWKSIIDKSVPGGRELCYGSYSRFAYVNGSYSSTSITAITGGIQVGFSNGTVLRYDVEAFSDWLYIELVSVMSGSRPSKVKLCRVTSSLRTNVGTTLNIAWDDTTSVCLAAANFQPTCKGYKYTSYALLRATTQDSPGPNIEGAAVALIICPTAEVKSVLSDMAHSYELLINEDVNGVPSTETLGRGSYWFFLNVSENDAETIIDYCQKANFKQVLISFNSWATHAGHISYNLSRFPRGADSLQDFVGTINNAGVGVGSHCFVSKVDKSDAFVTPVPTHKFWVEMETTLASDISATDTIVPVTSNCYKWPGGSSPGYYQGNVSSNYEFTIGDEIIVYRSLGGDSYNTFSQCYRGAYGTTASAHSAGERIEHWYTEGSGRYIIDPETTLLEEVCQYMADAFNECGFNQVYFDGSEDVPLTRPDYYKSLAHATAVDKFTVRPFMHMGGLKQHRLWHSMTLTGTIDRHTTSGYASTVKGHINISVNRAIEAQQSMMPAELGWFGIWPEGTYSEIGYSEGLQLDEIEYLMVKSLAYDAAISLEVSFSEIESHPLTDEILNIVRIYETMRVNRQVPESVTEPMKQLNADWSYIQSLERGVAEFVSMTKLSDVRGNADLRAWVGTMSNGDPVVTLWHYKGQSTPLEISPVFDVEVVNVDGEQVQLENVGGADILPVDLRRLTLIFRNMTMSQAMNILQDGKAREFGIIGQDSLLAHWKLDETSGVTAEDSANDNDATLVSEPAWVGGYLDNALEFDGIDDHMVQPLDIPAPTGLICHWVKADQLRRQVVFYQSDNGEVHHNGFNSANPMYEVHTGIDVDQWYCIYQDGAAIRELWAGNVTPGTWTHQAMTWDTAGDLVMYVNGVEVGRIDMSDASFAGMSPGVRYIGRVGDSDYIGRHWDGMVDDVHVYASQLSASEIAMVMAGDEVNAGVGRNPEPFNGEVSASLNPVLSWEVGDGVDSYDVYFSREAEPLIWAGRDQEAFLGTTEVNQIVLDQLEVGTTYYWAVDELKDGDLELGDIWHFTTAETASFAFTQDAADRLSWSHAIEAGPDRILVVGLSAKDSDVNDLVVSSVTYNGVAMMSVEGSGIIDGIDSFVKTELYYMLDENLPSEGDYDVEVIYSGVVDHLCAGAIPFVGRRQGPADSVACQKNVRYDGGRMLTILNTRTDEAMVVGVVANVNGGQFIETYLPMHVRYDLAGAGFSAAASTHFVEQAGRTRVQWVNDATGPMAQSVAAFAPAVFYDMSDLYDVCEDWLETGDGLEGDIYYDGFVDFKDMAAITRYWLE